MKYWCDGFSGALLHSQRGQRLSNSSADGTRMRRRIVVGFVVPLALALFTSMVVFQIVRTYNRSVANVTAASQASGDLNVLIKTVIDAETGQRGFAITGNEVFLEPYTSSTVNFGVALSSLRDSLSDSDSQASLNEIDALFERWQREVAGVVVGARRRTPVDLSSELRAASTAFTHARINALRYGLASSAPTNPALGDLTSGDPALGNLIGAQLAETERQLQRALDSGIRGPQLTAVRAAANRVAAQIEAFRGEQSQLRSRQAAPLTGLNLGRTQELDDRLGELATNAETAEAEVTALIRAGAGKKIVDQIRAQVADLSGRVGETLARTLETNNAGTRSTQWVAFIGPLFAALMSLLVTLQGQRQLERSVRQLGAVIKDVSVGQLERRLTLAPGNELRPLAEDFNRMADRLSEREGQNARLGEFSSTLQTCKTAEEAYRVTERFAPTLFESFAGALYRVSESRNVLEVVARWGLQENPGAESPSAESFNQASGLGAEPSAEPGAELQLYTPADCWALRRGKAQLVSGAHGVVCRHAPTPAPTKSLCTPLVTQDGSSGVLYLYSRSPAATLGEATERFVETVAEQLALALSNLRLRESLLQQSIRDPLTGLFNRRHLEETLDLELHRATRRGEPISAVMFDVDHFKRYNDLHGHDAGDAVLRALGNLVQTHIRAGDVACRFGGEEFLLLQPGLGAEDARSRAESLRQAVSSLSLTNHGVELGSITVSMGVATYPEHAHDRAALLKRADEALYRAKQEGRNRVVGAAIPKTVPQESERS